MIILLVRPKLNSMQVLISEALIDWNLSYAEFVLISNMLKSYADKEEEIINPRTSQIN